MVYEAASSALGKGSLLFHTAQGYPGSQPDGFEVPQLFIVTVYDRTARKTSLLLKNLNNIFNMPADNHLTFVPKVKLL